jgi:hypothetical protein
MRIKNRYKIPGLPRKVFPPTLQEFLESQNSGNIAAALLVLLLLQRELSRQPGYVSDANPPPMAIYAAASRSPHGIGCLVSPRLDEEARGDVLGTSER